MSARSFIIFMAMLSIVFLAVVYVTAKDFKNYMFIEPPCYNSVEKTKDILAPVESAGFTDVQMNIVRSILWRVHHLQSENDCMLNLLIRAFAGMAICFMLMIVAIISLVMQMKLKQEHPNKALKDAP